MKNDGSDVGFWNVKTKEVSWGIGCACYQIEANMKDVNEENSYHVAAMVYIRHKI